MLDYESVYELDDFAIQIVSFFFLILVFCLRKSVVLRDLTVLVYTNSSQNYFYRSKFEIKSVVRFPVFCYDCILHFLKINYV